MIESNQEVEQGLDYLLGHFISPHPELTIPLFPRTIATRLTGGAQVPVYSKEEALDMFAQADWIDCRVSAYPYWRPSKVTNFIGLKNPIAPNFIMIDLDKHNFRSMRVLVSINYSFDEYSSKNSRKSYSIMVWRWISCVPTDDSDHI